MTDRDLSSYITHTHLRIETAADALATMWLVECGVLPPADGLLPLELARYLGHGNVFVFLDSCANSKTLVLSCTCLAQLRCAEDRLFTRGSVMVGNGNLQSGEMWVQLSMNLEYSFSRRYINLRGSTCTVIKTRHRAYVD